MAELGMAPKFILSVRLRAWKFLSWLFLNASLTVVRDLLDILGFVLGIVLDDIAWSVVTLAVMSLDHVVAILLGRL